jgi:hypothetical protein
MAEVGPAAIGLMSTWWQPGGRVMSTWCTPNVSLVSEAGPAVGAADVPGGDRFNTDRAGGDPAH